MTQRVTTSEIQILLSKKRTLLFLFLFISLIYFITVGGHVRGDSQWIYCAVENLALEGDLDISKMKDTIDIQKLQGSYNTILYLVHDIKSEGYKTVYVQYGIGQILLEIPFYYVSHLASFLISFLPQHYFTIFAVSLLNIFIVSVTGAYI